MDWVFVSIVDRWYYLHDEFYGLNGTSSMESVLLRSRGLLGSVVLLLYKQQPPFRPFLVSFSLFVTGSHSVTKDGLQPCESSLFRLLSVEIVCVHSSRSMTECEHLCS